ncbi:MAG: hypothetical protein K2V38_15885 [Gemmataceae bacterium]|nr:hypothetical protein [Gemmataceae bacterium]
MKRLLSLATVAALAAGVLAIPGVARADKVAPPKKAGVLQVYDTGGLFTSKGIDRAKSTLGDTKFDHGLMMTVDTHKETPDGRKKFESDGEKQKFFQQWAKDLAKDDKAKGIYVLVCRSPGWVEVIADKETRDRGFSAKDEQELRDIFLKAFREAAGKPEDEQFKLRDDALGAAVGYVISDLKDTTVAGGTTAVNANTNTTTKRAGMGIGGWICLGLCILLCIWLVVGLIRVFTGGGGYGGGGGGGGFGTALLGGLFGAMAGMWLYNSMFGTHYGPDSFGGDAYASDGYSGSDADTGAGDFSGDAGAGGGFDDGGGDGGGGGDWGGGGGDYGGGGDGGGGGDWGGGDF